MKKVFLRVVFLVLFVVGASGVACANWTSEGWAEDGNGEVSQGPFNQIRIWWLKGDKFADPAITDLNVSGWANFNLSNTGAYAIGPVTDWLTWTFNFEGPELYEIGEPQTDFLYMVSLNQDVRWRQRITYNFGWSYPALSEQEWNSLGGGNPVVPEPISSALFVLGGGAMFAVKKLRKRKNS